MSTRNSENTEQLSAHARSLLNQQIRQQSEKAKDSLEQTSQEVRNAGRISVAGARRNIRAEWAELKEDGMESPLTGVVAFVCVRRDDKAVALRAALMAMGATVVLKWSVIVTHLIWQPGADSQVRVNARHLNAHVVTPKWVFTCAETCQRVPERKFIAPCRPSDPMDPHALTRILRIAEKENIPLLDISEEKDTSATPESGSKLKLRISVSSSDRSKKNLKDTSNELSKESPYHRSSSLEPSSETRVNTALRKVHPATSPPPKPLNSRRKLFTDMEKTDSSSDSEEKEPQPRVKCKNPYVLSQKSKKRTIKKKQDKHTTVKTNNNDIIKSITKIIDEKVCFTQKSPLKTINSSPKQKEIKIVLTAMRKATRRELLSLIRDLPMEVQLSVTSRTTHVVCGDVAGRHRTFSALSGAVRGCWVVKEKWLYDCVENDSLVPAIGYQVEELEKVSTRSRVERSALQLRSYAMLIFSDMRIRVKHNAQNYKRIVALLKLCGAILVDNDQEEVDLTISSPGYSYGENFVVSRWVSESIIAGRPRSTRKYLL